MLKVLKMSNRDGNIDKVELGRTYTNEFVSEK